MKSELPAPIFLITGPPGAGKSSVARELLQRFPFGFHIPMDDLREWVVSGVAHPVPTWTDETTRQFTLARRGAIQLAKQYASAGFVVVIDDIVNAQDVDQFFRPALEGYRFHTIILLPPVATSLQRNRERTNKTFDTTILDEPIRNIHSWIQEQKASPDEWLTIDNSSLTIAETINVILSRFDLM